MFITDVRQNNSLSVAEWHGNEMRWKRGSEPGIAREAKVSSAKSRKKHTVAGVAASRGRQRFCATSSGFLQNRTTNLPSLAVCIHICWRGFFRPTSLRSLSPSLLKVVNDAAKGASVGIQWRQRVIKRHFLFSRIE